MIKPRDIQKLDKKGGDEADIFLLEKVVDVEEDLTEEISDVRKIAEKKPDKGEKGDPGDKGEPGKTPIAGQDYPIPEDGRTPTRVELREIIEPLIPEPIPGSPDRPEEVKNKLESLKNEKRLDASAIKNLPRPIMQRS